MFCRILFVAVIMCSFHLYSESVIITSADRSRVTVTVYNSSIALVQEDRLVTLPKGVGELRFQDVPSTIQPPTVLIRSKSTTGNFIVLEQNYEYDLMNRAKLLDKYVGKKIKIIRENQFKDTKDFVEATLLSNNGDQIYKLKNEIYLGYSGQIVLPTIPNNLIARPTLMWRYENEKKQEHILEVSYLAGSVSWLADYVFQIGETDDNCALTGWVTVNNNCGTGFENARLKLIAGDVNRVTQLRSKSCGTNIDMMINSSPPVGFGGGFEQKEFFEYHMYTLPRKTTIKNNQSKQILFLEGTKIPAKKEFVVSSRGATYNRIRAGRKEKLPVDVFMVFTNDENSGLGKPMPKGTIRVYKKDSDDGQIFLGEDRIHHTPEDEDVCMKIGRAFDVVVERKQMSYTKIGKQNHESEWEIRIRNRKKEKVSIILKEYLHGKWKIIKSSVPFKKMSVNLAEAKVAVASGKEVVITYQVKIKY